ncbi:Nn.00g112110.m01.CDS01 [Neocucurbitaria sp. VM-36]
MDPLSIASSVLRITTTCIEAAKTLNDVRHAWKRAPVTVSSLCAQLKLTAASLSQIQSLLLNNTDILQDKHDLVETFDTTLTSCLVLSTWLEKCMQKITRGVLDGTKASWKIKFRTLWNEEEVKELLQQLHTQQGAISVLVGLMQMDSMSDIRKFVRRHEALLREIVNNTRDLRQSHAIEAPGSILEPKEADGSIFSKLAEDHTGDDTLEGSFESVVLTTKVYSKAFTSALGCSAIDDPDDAETITNIDKVSKKYLPSDQTATSLPTSILATRQIIVPSHSFQAALKYLYIFNIYAHFIVTHVAKHPEGLTLQEAAIIEQPRKVSEDWYWGRIGTTTDDKPPQDVLFERSKVIICFELEKPLLVRDRRNIRLENPDRKSRITRIVDEFVEVS